MKEITISYFTFILIALSSIISISITSLYARRFSLQSRRLQLNEQYYKSLFDQNPDVILTFDLNGTFQSANNAVSSLFGYKVQEIINKPFTPFIVPEDQEFVFNHFKMSLKGQANTFECMIYDKKGQKRDIRVTNIPIYINGKITGVYAILKDNNYEKIIKHMAYHDQLTGLPNRYLLQEKLNKVIDSSEEKNKAFALLFLDLDRFKMVNDTIGHEMGDKLLIDITQRLKKSIDKSDVISRYGGDEFILFLPDSGRLDAEKTAERILEKLSQPFTLNHQEFLITPSIGISLYPNDGTDYDELIKNADLAMYHAKSLGKNNFQFFKMDLRVHSKNEIELESSLRKALEREEFVLYYQPQFNLETNQIIGAEALIRWYHPEKGIVSPAEFIPAAEETGLIIPIGEWALRNACYQNKKWQDSGLPPITVSVNISAKQFFQSNLVELVQKILEETGMDPKYLELEITESMTMDVERAISTLIGLKKIGVKISVDDFGTGYSSLNYLKKFPIDKLKVDQSFIRDSMKDPHDETIVKTIIAMAHNLHLKVIAEGVETKEHISFLLNQMCTEAQGFYFSKPIPVSEFDDKYIKNHLLPLEPP